MDEWIAESETGGRKGQKLARFDLLDPGVMDAIARQFGRGAFKYGDRNYQKGYNWSLSYAAAQRHLNAFWDGQNWDADPFWDQHDLGRPHHLDAAIFHLMALREFFDKHPEYDDRAKVSQAKARIRTEAERLEWVSPVAPTPQGNGDEVQTSGAEQTQEGWDGAVQDSRWHLP